MSIVLYKKLINNIGIDIGNGIMLIILKNNQPINYTISQDNTISFIIPEIMVSYKILLYMGNNILSSNNIFLDEINIISPDKVIFITFIISELLYVNNLLLLYISTKTKLISYHFINIIYSQINLSIDMDTDIYKYKLKFELIKCIELIRDKIKNRVIILSYEMIVLLEKKLNQIISNIDTYNNQKLLDIKKNLSIKFFL